ncbi:MAG: Holliday junction branch migration protein RuvA [Campylobacterales bacterium]
MIAAIEGDVYKKEPTKLYLKCSGIVYEINISLNSSSAIDTKSVFLYTKEIIRDDCRELYGFVDRGEKELFEKLIKISGVGAKTALAILSTFSPSQFIDTLAQSDQKALQKVPGIGAKSAGRILVELQGYEATFAAMNSTPSKYAEAEGALINLGFKKDDITKLLKDIDATDTASIIKEALKRIKR